MQLRFAHEGREYQFDNTLSLAEAMMIKAATDLTAGQFLSGIGQMDGAALAGMVLLAKMRAGEDTTWSDLASMDLVKLIESVGELNKPDDEAKDDEPATEPVVEEHAEPVRSLPVNGLVAVDTPKTL